MVVQKFRVWDTVKKAMSEVQAIVYAEEKVYPILFEEKRKLKWKLINNEWLMNIMN